MLLGVLVAAIVVADQTTKWWAWRYCATVTINSGGDELVGGVVGSWFRSTVGGAVLDVADSAALGAVVVAVLRRRRATPVLLSVAVFLAGWTSNLADRLGLHYWTAPSSVRGAVDFLRLGGGTMYNGADIVIVVGAVCSTVSLCWCRRGSPADETSADHAHADQTSADPVLDAATRRDRSRPGRGRYWALVGLAVVTVLAAYGARHAGCMYTPARLWPVG